LLQNQVNLQDQLEQQTKMFEQKFKDLIHLMQQTLPAQQVQPQSQTQSETPLPGTSKIAPGRSKRKVKKSRKTKKTNARKEDKIDKDLDDPDYEPEEESESETESEEYLSCNRTDDFRVADFNF
jgi:hypothetical protein